MKGKILLIVGIIIVVIVLIMTLGGGSQYTVDDDPMNIVLNFYEPWLESLQSEDGNPYDAGLLDNPILSSELRDKIASERANMSEGDVDPVLCLETIPENIIARPLTNFDGEFKVIIMSAEDEFAGQAIVTLMQKRGGWYIEDILCSHGEFAPEEREFSFEKEGFLIKGSTASLNPEYWYIVFEEGGQEGHTAPLLFDSTSLCSNAGGASFICNPNNLEETSAVMVRGQLSEVGVEVKQMEIQ